MPCRLAVSTSEGRVYRIAKQDYEGFHTRPAGWPVLRAKFAALGRRIDQGLAGEIADTIEHLEQIAVTDLTALLARVRITEGADDDDGADL
jgi:2-methylcitrate dehydratase